MNYYPQYIHIPTAAPVQRYFADPHVQINRYDGLTGSSFLGVASNPFGKLVNAGKALFGDLGEKANGFFGKSGTLGNVFGGNKLSASAGGLVTGIGGAVGKGLYSLGTGKFDRGTGAGKAISGIGSAAGDLIGKVNPLLGGIVKAGSGLIGGLANRISGYHLNDATIGAINSDINALNSTRIADSSNESIANQAAAQNWGGAFGLRDIGSWGWASKGKVQNQFDKLQRGMQSGQNYMAANYDNAATNVSKNTMSNLLINSSAFGGELDPFAHSGSMATLYSMGQQRLAQQLQAPNQMQAQQPMQQPMQPMQGTQYGFGGCLPFCFGGRKFGCGGRFFSFGGDLNTHGSDFTNGLVYIDNGGTHEENPYQGVPMGYDQQGTPNVVEENEVIAPKRLLGDGGEMSDYVFSDRIPVTDEFADKYHVPRGISIARAIRKITKESRETPNDPIHENTNRKILAEARDMQEQIKQEQQQQEQEAMQQAIAQMPPEQQQAIMQQAQMQGMGMQEQAPEQGQEMSTLGIPQPAMGAFGGNLFAKGGFFRPVNMFAYGNEFNKGITPQTAWEAIMLPVFMKQLQEEMGASGADIPAIISRYNKLQDLYKDAGMLGYNGSVIVNDNIKPLQEYFQSLGMNKAFTQDLIDQYYNSATHGGRTPDKMDLFNPDGRGGGYTALRTLGAGALSTGSVEAMNNALNRYGVEYVQDNDGLWRLRQLSGTTSTASPASGSVSPETEKSDYEKLLDQLNSRDGNGDAGYGPGKRWEPLDTSLRMAPIWASGIATLMDQLGLTNTPDYAGARYLERLGDQSRGYMPVSYKPVGEKMSYNPFDPYQAMIARNALAAQASRAIQDNSNGNGAMANASQVALNRNNATASGELALKGREYNDNLYNTGLGFNRQTDYMNGQGTMYADAQNAQNWRLGQNTYNSLIGNALELRQQEKQAADTARALNLSAFIKSLSSLGKENMYYNMVMGSPTAGGYSFDKRGEWNYYNNSRRPSMATNPYVAQVPDWSLTDVGADIAAKNQTKYSLMPEDGFAWLRRRPFFNYNG